MSVFVAVRPDVGLRVLSLLRAFFVAQIGGDEFADLARPGDETATAGRDFLD